MSVPRSFSAYEVSMDKAAMSASVILLRKVSAIAVPPNTPDVGFGGQSLLL